MGGDYFKLAVPLIVFVVLLLDLKRFLEEYRDDRSKTMIFKILGIFIIVALVISIVLGLLDIAGRPVSNTISTYSKTFNIFVLMGYLIFTRFQRRKKER